MAPRNLLGLLASAALLPAPAIAQMSHSMPGMSMPGMTMPAKKKPAAKKAPAKKRPARTTRAAKPSRSAQARSAARRAAKPASTPHHTPGAKVSGMAMPAHDMSSMPGMAMPHGGATPAPHDMSSMPGMAMPAQGSASPPAPSMTNMPGMNMGHGEAAGHQMQGMNEMPGSGAVGTNLPAGSAPPPPVPADHAADQVYPADAMAMGRHEFQTMHGGTQFYQLMFNIAEYQARKGGDGYNWDAEAWYGGDINRFWIKSEGEGAFREGVERAEVQALYSRAIGPYFNLQGGVRYDIRPKPSRVYAALGVEGLAPSFFEVEGFLFLSNKGDLLARAGAYYDQRITERLILQPRAELNFAAQDVPEDRIGSGLSDAELGLRLRYDIRREFAPYVGVEYQRNFGDTAAFRRAGGERASGWNFLFGVRAWF